ncbi:26S proteasome regulatory subunit rpn11 [Ophiocordyceps camponoti-floridani]|uniref:26S proteasome regulatory subunit rpn11 n=1 Tax=Ophiocordyceps camponoti-floridani TaxID=2030778 RepID=A0A8H4VFN6_9HYPO|nr:26S proteasome regulatory subunit rpn11 [Ophiocordyceps camponoti-floridani]
MTKPQIHEVATLLKALFPSHPHATSDESALLLHGNPTARPETLTIVTPSPQSATALLASAQDQGLRSNADRRAFYVETRHGVPRCVRVFHTPDFRVVDLDGVAVLSREVVADRVASRYRAGLERGDDEVAQKRAADLLWLLSSFVDEWQARALIEPLARRHPETLVLIRIAGFPISFEVSPRCDRFPRPWRSTVCIDDGVTIRNSTDEHGPSALLYRTLALVHAATRLRLLAKRARVASGAWPAPLRPRYRPGTVVSEVPRRSLARLPSVDRTIVPPARTKSHRASCWSMDIVIGKDIVLWRDSKAGPE